MKEIVERLTENRQIELAKSILESNGYKVSKRLKESNIYTYKGPIYSDRRMTNKIADVDVEVSEQTPRAVAQAAGLDTSDSESSFFIRTQPRMKSGTITQNLCGYNEDARLSNRAESKALEKFRNAHPECTGYIDVVELTATSTIIDYRVTPTYKISATLQGTDEDGVTHEETFVFSLDE